MEPYPMKWFRMYSEVLNDPKVQLLQDGAFRAWVNLLCLANDANPRGRIDPAVIPYALRMDQARADRMIAYFVDRGLLEREGDALVPHGWDSRQFASDNVTERSRQHRRNVARNVPDNVAEPLPGTELHRPQKQIQKQSTETENPPNPPEGGMGVVVIDEDELFATFWKLVMRKEPSRAKAREAWDKARKKAAAAEIVAGLERWLPVWEQFDDATKIPHITTWLNQQRWTVEQPLAPGDEPARRDREPLPPLPRPEPQDLEARRERAEQALRADEAEQMAREQEAIEQAAEDPQRAPWIPAESWARMSERQRKDFWRGV